MHDLSKTEKNIGNPCTTYFRQETEDDTCVLLKKNSINTSSQGRRKSLFLIHKNIDSNNIGLRNSPEFILSSS